MDSPLQFLLETLNLVGIVAFAASGAIVGLQKRFDLFGVLFLACITATWGGILRDVILGLTPPAAFTHPAPLSTALTTGLLIFIRAKRLAKWGEIVLLWTDAVGLGVFTAIGASKAYAVPECSFYLVVMTGLLTGIGGGMLRDVLAKERPLVLRREVYATACIAGAGVLYFAQPYVESVPANYLCFATTTGIRLFSKYRNINMPKASLRREK